MSAVTEIIVRCVIERNRHLLLARQRGRSWSFLPGGHVEPGEPVAAALAREIAEELGNVATTIGFVGVVEHGYTDDSGAHHELNLVFEVALGEAEPVSQEGHLEFHWLPLDRLADADVRPAALKDALVARQPDRTPFWRGLAVDSCAE